MKLAKYVAIAAILTPAGATALGVGDIRLHSSLNELLSADIPLVLSGQDSLNTIQVSLANADDFAKAGIARPNYLSQLQFKAVLASGGRFAIQVTSRDAITEPYLDFLVEIESPQGKLLREFSLLLDPPAGLNLSGQRKYVPSQNSDEASAYLPPVVQPVIQNPHPEPTRKKYLITPPTPQQLNGQNYGPVARGERLLEIAETIKKPASVNPLQMAAGLYAANPESFKRNAQGLQAGSTLKIPDEAYLSQISEIQARTTLKTRVSELAATDASSEMQQSAPLESSSPEPTQINASPPPAPTGTGSASAQLKKENEELHSRLEIMEQKLADALRMLALKDAELTALRQHQQTETLAEASQPSQANNNSIAVNQDKAEGAPQPSASPETNPASTPIATQAEPTPLPQTSAPAAPKTSAIAPKPVAPKPVPVVQEEPSFLMDSEYWLLSSSLALLGLGAWQIRRRRAQALSPEPTIPAASLPQATAKEITPAAATAITSDTAPHKLTILEPLNLAIQPLTNTTVLDPISETDVYIGYGRYQQAETLIRAAMKANPEAVELKSKLLEIYARSNNMEAFDAYMLKLRTDETETLPHSFWDTVQALNPAQSTSEVPDISALLKDQPDQEKTLQPSGDISSLEPDESSIDDDIKAFEAEFSQENLESETITLPTLTEEAEATEETDGHLIEFSISSASTEPTNVNAPVPVHLENLIAYEPDTEALSASNTKTKNTKASTTLELAALDLPETAQTMTTKTENSSFGVLDFKLALIDIPTPPAQTDSSGSNPQEEDLQTRLDLAKTYISMDDKNAARELLQELSACSSPHIRAEVEATLNRLGKVQLTLVSSMPLENTVTEELSKTTAAR